jgi:DNA-binding NarL/FixJ family response regulator
MLYENKITRFVERRITQRPTCIFDFESQTIKPFYSHSSAGPVYGGWSGNTFADAANRLKPEEQLLLKEIYERSQIFFSSFPSQYQEESSLEWNVYMMHKDGQFVWTSLNLIPFAFTADRMIAKAICSASYSNSLLGSRAYIRNVKHNEEYVYSVDSKSWKKYAYRPLNEREWTIMQLTSQGYLNKEIASMCHLSENNIKKIKHFTIYEKLHSENVHEAIAVMRRMYMPAF